MAKTNYIIITHARSGSHMIGSYLDSHPEISFKDDVFNSVNQMECDNRYRDYLSQTGDADIIKGFRIPYRKMNSNNNDIWQKIVSNKQFKIIHWQRSNLLRTYISWAIAKKTKAWMGNKTQPELDEKRISLKFSEFEKWITKIITLQQKSEYEFRNHVSFTVCYEDFLADKNKMKEILHFLEVDPDVALITEFRKQNPEPLDQLIINYDEFAASFQNTKWAAFLET